MPVAGAGRRRVDAEAGALEAEERVEDELARVRVALLLEDRDVLLLAGLVDLPSASSSMPTSPATSLLPASTIRGVTRLTRRPAGEVPSWLWKIDRVAGGLELVAAADRQRGP